MTNDVNSYHIGYDINIFIPYGVSRLDYSGRIRTVVIIIFFENCCLIGRFAIEALTNGVYGSIANFLTHDNNNEFIKGWIHQKETINCPTTPRNLEKIC